MSSTHHTFYDPPPQGFRELPCGCLVYRWEHTRWSHEKGWHIDNQGNDIIEYCPIASVLWTEARQIVIECWQAYRNGKRHPRASAPVFAQVNEHASQPPVPMLLT